MSRLAILASAALARLARPSDDGAPDPFATEAPFLREGWPRDY